MRTEVPYSAYLFYKWGSHPTANGEFVDGAVRVPTGPGLGVELDLERLDAQHRVYLDSGRTTRDDTTYMRSITPSYDPALPRF
ncbi:hypothetical protein [Planctomonas psychrotolerans]|uniref:hypothetical protein n=1 Tax=Planctomonas psychrotolerans TaxID=2528712 RepID=UPI00123C5D50|nr:hypothetical protein [Planctomonas psychrotolerans]